MDGMDYTTRAERERIYAHAMAELLSMFAQIDSSDGNSGNELARQEFLRTHPEFIGYAKQARALLAKVNA